MKLNRRQVISFLLIVLVLFGTLFSPTLAQDEEDTPPVAEETTMPVETVEQEEVPVIVAPPEPNPWLRFVQMLGDGINSFVGGASFMALLLYGTGKLSTDRHVLGLLENATQGLRDSYPPETRQWIVDLGTAIRNVGVTIEEVFDDIPIADKPEAGKSETLG